MKWILILVTVLYSGLSYSVEFYWQSDVFFNERPSVSCPDDKIQSLRKGQIEHYIKAFPAGVVFKDFKYWQSGNNQCHGSFKYAQIPSSFSCPDGEIPLPDGSCGNCTFNSSTAEYDCISTPPENKCKVPAGEILARRSGIEGANGRYYCVKQCSGIAKQVGDMCIAVGDGPNICDYELISSGVDCDGNGDGSTDGDGSGNPPPPPEPIPPETGDGSNDNGDGSLEPDINGDGSGGSGDINGDGTINGADYGGNLAKIVENTAKTAVAVNTNTNMITDAINKQTKAITDAVNNGNGSGNGSGTPDGDGDGEADSVNGGSCEQFVCNGPAVQCYIAQKQWEQKCDIEGVIAQNEKPVIDGINTFINDNPITNIEAGTLDISTYFNKYDGSNGIQTGGSCPAPISISLGEYGSHTVKLDPLCELAVIIRVFLQITAVVSVGLMFAKYS
ncbi:TPA: virulence factor TspB C-terminal domain-related protein [Photobacterium damselae]